MARIKLQLPGNFIFSTEIPVMITDINYGGHLGNDKILSIIHEARVRFLANYGFTESDIMGVGIIMSDCAIQYKNESFYGDKLAVSITPVEYSNKGFELFYLLKNSKNGNEIARAKTGLVCFDYENRKIVNLPEGLEETWK